MQNGWFLSNSYYHGLSSEDQVKTRERNQYNLFVKGRMATVAPRILEGIVGHKYQFTRVYPETIHGYTYLCSFKPSQISE